MATWGVLSDKILTGLLEAAFDPDADSESEQFTPDQLLICAGWACAEISMHTAQLASTTFTGDGTSSTFTLPAGISDPIERAGAVIYENDAKALFLQPVRQLPVSSWPTDKADEQDRFGFYEFPQGTLVLTFIPAAGSTIRLRYYKQWDAPADDNSNLNFPSWLEVPFCYITAAYAMEVYGTQASMLRQWNRKQDSGDPEHNSRHKQIEFFKKQAYAFLAKAPKQDRETFFRVDKTRGDNW